MKVLKGAGERLVAAKAVRQRLRWSFRVAGRDPAALEHVALRIAGHDPPAFAREVHLKILGAAVRVPEPNVPGWTDDIFLEIVPQTGRNGEPLALVLPLKDF